MRKRTALVAFKLPVVFDEVGEHQDEKVFLGRNLQDLKEGIFPDTLVALGTAAIK